MCEFCDPEKRSLAIQRARRIADPLRTLAANYEQMASGHIKPHSKEVEIVGIRGKNLVRELVEEWV
jgi:hypothetical protein